MMHDAHGYSTWDRVVQTGSILFRPPSVSSLLTRSVLKGRTVIGLYFSADWCSPCQAFNPLLKKLYSDKRAHCNETNRHIPPFEVVLVSRCRDARASEHYFSTMPWSAMLHAEATGTRGRALRDKFAITTIPALVLLDGEGAVLCRNAHERLRDDPLGEHFPWRRPPAAPRVPRVDFDIVACSLPERASAGVPLRRPPGKPPTFATGHTHDKERGKSSLVGSQVGGSNVSQVGSQVGQEPGPQPAPQVGPTPAPTASTPKRKPPAPTDVPRPRPPPKPGARPSPSLASRAVQALAATAATSQNIHFVPRHLATDRSDFPQGKPTSLMQPQPLSAVHPFTPTLNKWRHGIEVDCGPDWSWDVVEAAVARGPHPTAATPDSIALFKEDIAYQVKAGFCKVMLWEDLQRLRPHNLKISPVAVVPQTGRRGRIILDLSFPVYQDVNGVATAVQSSVNDTTKLSAPDTPVKEIGKVLPRLLHYMRDTPAGLHILFSKLDISDGFWRLIVQEADSYNFAYVLPQEAGEPCRVVVPAAVQMGWVESPSHFCTVTETARDITQHCVDNLIALPHDPIEESMTIVDVPLRGRTRSPTKLLQVYVDDFCYAATQSEDGEHIPTIRRAAVHGIHAVFPPTSVTHHTDGKEPISAKKLAAGDGNFDTKKEMIGFVFDGVKRTVHLPPAKAAAYIKETHTLLRRKTVPLKKLQMLVGKLRHASIILPAAKGFFSPLNDAMRGNPKLIGLGADSEVRRALEDLISLMHLLSSRPTHVRELVPDVPHHASYHDAAAEGAGGVWFSLCDDTPPVVWREQFPDDIAKEVVSVDTPHGRLTNSDLELAAEVLAVGVALERTNSKHTPLGTLCDNTPTVSWVDRMASKSKSPTAGRLLRGLAFMLYCAQAGRLTTVHVPGVENVMADIASRPTKAQQLFRSASALSDSNFRSSFDTAFPLPGNQQWTLASVPSWLRSNVFETLRGKRLALQLWTDPSGIATGKRGKRIAGSIRTPPAKSTRLTSSLTDSSPLLSPCGKASTVKDIRSRFSLSNLRSEPLPKSMFWTDIPTHGAPHPPSSPWTSPSPVS